MKYIKKVADTPHAKDVYEVHITKAEVETLDLILSLYSPFLGFNKVLLMDGRKMTMKYRLKGLRMGINQIKKSIEESE